MMKGRTEKKEKREEEDVTGRVDRDRKDRIGEDKERAAQIYMS